ncbi:MAG: SGNH/GDSL hydrolase family protein [Gammaproteobacteria bacterium]|nr:MAG: SGNH/GDSL hydrolase family protein [Gammaproteobacteria bacterium]
MIKSGECPLLFREMHINMDIKKNLPGIILAICLLIPLNVSAALYSDIYVFGDSLSDSGNLSALTLGALPGDPYFAGRFSNGPTYAEHLAFNLGLTLSPSIFGGNNYAIAGALTGSFPLDLPFGVTNQINSFIGSTPALDPDALYVVFSGGNNLLAAIDAAQSTPGQASSILQNTVSAAATDISQMIGALTTAGANNILVPNLPDFSLLPGVRTRALTDPDIAGFASLLSGSFNTALDSILGAYNANNIIGMDVFSLFNDLTAFPASVGLTNVTDACYDGTNVCSDPNSYLFWDSIHPSALGHLVLGAAALNAVTPVPEPASIVLFMMGILLLLLVNKYQRKQR